MSNVHTRTTGQQCVKVLSTFYVKRAAMGVSVSLSLLCFPVGLSVDE